MHGITQVKIYLFIYLHFTILHDVHAVFFLRKEGSFAYNARFLWDILGQLPRLGT
jgi:hypothetical protein